MGSIKTPDELAIIKYRATQSSLFFTRYFFKEKHNRKLVVNSHHEIICDALDKVIKGEITKLIINIAPRYGKTELAVKNFIAHGLSINPAARFIHLSYSDDLALDNSDEVRELIKHEAYQQIYPEVQIKPNSDSKKKWYTTAGGGVYATSASGQVTGFGAGRVDDEEDFDFIKTGKGKFAGALIIDDPIKPDDGDSETIREKVNNKYDSTIKNRVNSRNTPIIIIMQRLHDRDLCGYLMEQNPGEWTVLSLPCIKEDGTALWEFKHTLAELNKIKEENEIVFERQYMQDPQPLKGLLFPAKQLNYYVPTFQEEYETSMGYVDVADEGSDHLSAPVGRHIGSKVYIPEVIFNKENTDVTLPQVQDLFTRHQVRYARVESNNMGAMYGRSLSKLVPETQVQLINNRTNKHTRILTYAAFIRKHFWFVHPDYQTPQYKKFMKELCSYMKEVELQPHDDAPDSLSGLAVYVSQMYQHLYPNLI